MGESTGRGNDDVRDFVHGRELGLHRITAQHRGRLQAGILACPVPVKNLKKEHKYVLEKNIGSRLIVSWSYLFIKSRCIRFN